MHHVNKKRKKALTLRFTAYAVTLTLTAITTVVLLFVALGYRFNSADGDVVRSGLLLVDSKPEAAEIYINNELKDNAAPGRFILKGGSYDISLRRDGYRNWEKNIAVDASGVSEAKYPILIPEKLNAKSVGKSFAAPSFVSQSKNRKNLLTHVTNQTEFKLTQLDKDTPKVTALPLSDQFVREEGKAGAFKLIEWALDGRHVLLEQTLPSGTVQIMSFDIGKPESAINISKLYGVETPSDIHYVGGNTDAVYGIKDGLLKKQSLSTASIEILLQNVRTYQPYGDNIILYESIASDETISLGIMKNDTSKIIKKKIDPTIKHFLKYAEYDKEYYYVAAEENGPNVTLYRDPLDTPAGVKMKPFITLPFENTKQLTFSGSSQFIFAQNGNRALTYDLRELLSYKLELPFAVSPSEKLEWIDGFHLIAIAEDGSGHLLDYDGKNLQKLIGIKSGSRLYFAPDMRSLFRINIKDENQILEEIDLVTAADK